MDTPAFKQLAEQCAQLTEAQWERLLAARGKQALPVSVTAIIEAARAPMTACPHCASSSVHRHGHASGLQRYRCASCRRSFNVLTGTPLARLRMRGKWLGFLDCMLDSRTVRAAAAATGVHRNTSFRWRHRFLDCARHDRTVPLGGIVEADETYLLESQKGSRTLTRPARRRGGHAAKRGLSGELDCILVARGRDGNTVDFVTGRAPLKKAQLLRHLAPVLARDCVLVSDGHPAYQAFARASGISHQFVSLRGGARMRGAVHVQNVNAYHSRFKRWLQRFHGVASRYLANYLGWQWALDGQRISGAANFLHAMLSALPSAP